ncbi:MAG: alpha/beta fold hydrolase [Thiohalocapsa sp.]
MHRRISLPDLPDNFESLRLPAAGIQLHAVVGGPADGSPVILLHGFPEFWYGWRRQLQPLADAGLRVVAPDQRGYNLSDKPAGVAVYRLDALADDVLALADALGHRRFAVVGHDWGGVVAWHLAARNPERVSRAAILNAPHPATLRRYALRHMRQLGKELVRLLFPAAVPAGSLAAPGRVVDAGAGAARQRAARNLHSRDAAPVSPRLGSARRFDRGAQLVPRATRRPGRLGGAANPSARAGDLGRPRRLSRTRPRRIGRGPMRASGGDPRAARQPLVAARGRG